MIGHYSCPAASIILCLVLAINAALYGACVTLLQDEAVTFGVVHARYRMCARREDMDTSGLKLISPSVSPAWIDATHVFVQCAGQAIIVEGQALLENPHFKRWTAWCDFALLGCLSFAAALYLARCMFRDEHDAAVTLQLVNKRQHRMAQYAYAQMRATKLAAAAA
jgi:hypothetical protein